VRDQERSRVNRPFFSECCFNVLVAQPTERVLTTVVVDIQTTLMIIMSPGGLILLISEADDRAAHMTANMSGEEIEMMLRRSAQ
jgi:hypothetical protein